MDEMSRGSCILYICEFFEVSNVVNCGFDSVCTLLSNFTPAGVCYVTIMSINVNFKFSQPFTKSNRIREDSIRISCKLII